MNARVTLVLTLLAALASAAGCAAEASRPPLSDTWGQSVRMAVQNQKLNPEPADDRPVAGLDGVFAKNAMDAYRKSSEPDAQAGGNGGQYRPKPIETIVVTKEVK